MHKGYRNISIFFLILYALNCSRLHAQSCNVTQISDTRLGKFNLTAPGNIRDINSGPFFSIIQGDDVRVAYLQDTFFGGPDESISLRQIKYLTIQDTGIRYFDFIPNSYNNVNCLSNVTSTFDGKILAMLQDFSLDPFVKNPKYFIKFSNSIATSSFSITVKSNSKPLLVAGRSGIYLICSVYSGQMITIDGIEYANSNPSGLRILSFYINDLLKLNLSSDKTILSTSPTHVVNAYSLRNDLLTVISYAKELEIKDTKTTIGICSIKRLQIPVDTGYSLLLYCETSAGKMISHDQVDFSNGGEIQQVYALDSSSFSFCGVYSNKMYINGEIISSKIKDSKIRQGFIVSLKFRNGKCSSVVFQNIGSDSPVSKIIFDPNSGIVVAKFDSVAHELIHAEDRILLNEPEEYCFFKVLPELKFSCLISSLKSQGSPIEICSNAGKVFIFYEERHYNKYNERFRVSLYVKQINP
jgi:hypothetical protein